MTARRTADQAAARRAGQIEAALRAAGDQGRAVQEKAYLNSELEHLGVRVPRTRAIATRPADAPASTGELVAVIRALWSRPVYELRLAAVELLTSRVELLGPAELALIERLLRESRTWALVDHLAEKVAGAVVAAHPDSAVVLDRWSVDPDLWIRRAALLALLGPLRRGDGDRDRLSRYADRMLAEDEFFISKAIGWTLRETGRRHPQWVREWLESRPGRVPVLAVREAVKPLPGDCRPGLIAAARRRAR